MQPADVNSHPLEQECGALSNGFIVPFRKPGEELLMTINRMGQTGGSELVCEKNRLTQRPILVQR